MRRDARLLPRPAGDPRVDQHRDREVLDVQDVWPGLRLVIEIELAPVGFADSPLFQQYLDVFDAPVELDAPYITPRLRTLSADEPEA